jgi:hypothetical protein
MATYSEDLKIFMEELTKLRDKLAAKPFCLNDDEDLLPAVGNLFSKLIISTDNTSIMERATKLALQRPLLDETEGKKQTALLKNEAFSIIEATIQAESKILPLFRNPGSSKAKNQPLVDYLRAELREFKTQLGAQSQDKPKPTS